MPAMVTKPTPPSGWPDHMRRALDPFPDVDVDALLGHLARASHVKAPSPSWLAKAAALGGAPEVLGALLALYTPDGGHHPNTKGTLEAQTAWGAAWATLVAPTAANLRLLERACPWCRTSSGPSHQFAYVCAQVLGRWPDDEALRILEQLERDPSLGSLLPTLRASLKRQRARAATSS